MLLINILLALIWAALTATFTPVNLVIGFLIGYTLLWFSRLDKDSSLYFRRVPLALGFAFYFIWELVKANLKVAYDVLTPRLRIRPGVVAVPLDVTTDTQITLLANLITLTPGTLSVEVGEDRQVLYVHAMFIEDPELLRREIKDGFERRVLEVTQ